MRYTIMAKEPQEKNCSFKSILKTIDSLDMQINRIKNQLTELKLIVREKEKRSDVLKMENLDD
jgi:regulator of replication initiation timing